MLGKLLVVLAAGAVVSAAAADPIDLSGGYLGGTLLYGTTGLTSADSPDRHDHGPWPSSRHHDLDVQSASAGAVAGWNFMNGSSLIGIEARLTAGLSEENYGFSFSKTHWYPTVMPYGDYLNLIYYKPAGTIERTDYRFGPYIQQENYRYDYSFKEVASPDLTVRLGQQFDRVLLFLKVGGGASLIKETETRDDRGSSYCSQFSDVTEWMDGGRYRRYSDPCSARVQGTISSRTSTSVVPLAVFGAGFEYHWDRAFFRAEGEIRQLFTDDLIVSESGGLTQFRAGTTIGYRF